MKTTALSLLVVSLAAAAPADSLRSQIEASNKAICSAMMKKDFATLGKSIKAGITPNFVYVEEGVPGKGQTFDQMMANMKMGLAQMGKLTSVNAKILTVKEMGKTAVSTSTHTIGAMMPGPDHKTHQVAMSGTSTETYVKVGTKWKMSKMAWKDGTMTMDGKPMNPTKMGGH